MNYKVQLPVLLLVTERATEAGNVHHIVNVSSGQDGTVLRFILGPYNLPLDTIFIYSVHKAQKITALQ